MQKQLRFPASVQDFWYRSSGGTYHVFNFVRFLLMNQDLDPLPRPGLMLTLHTQPALLCACPNTAHLHPTYTPTLPNPIILLSFLV